MNNINWNEVLLAVIVPLTPVLIELLTGIGRAMADYLQAHVTNAQVSWFLADLRAFAASKQATVVKALKDAAADGKLTSEEKAQLKAMFQGFLAELLKRYPAKLTGYLQVMAEHWLEAEVAKLAGNPTQTASPNGSPETLEGSPEELALANGVAVQCK